LLLLLLRSVVVKEERERERICFYTNKAFKSFFCAATTKSEAQKLLLPLTTEEDVFF
tara:strand:- start:280 stop:450 length:171 start_codon:yes stop_codon:yes gene_type:complete